MNRLSAAAFAVGLSLAGPCAVAAADTADDASAPAPANPAARQGASSTNDAGRARTSAARAGGSQRGAPTVTADGSAPPAPASAQDRADRSAQHAADPDPDVSDAGTQAAGEIGVRAPRGTRTTVTGTPRAAAIPAVADPAPAAEATPAVGPLDDVRQPAPVPTTTFTPTATAPVSATVASVPAGAAVTDPGAGGPGDPLSGIQSFLEGIALLVRRTFFNQAPTVNPVQTTGEVTGPITGSIGAIDPEGDTIVYTVTRNPQFGTVVVGSDGSYVYTPDPDFAGLDTFVVSAADQGLHINLFDPFRPADTLANAVVSQGRTAWVRFDFRYGGVAVLWSPQARSTLEYAATILSSYLVVDTPVTVTYTVEGQFAPLSGQLASATSDLVSSQPGFHPTVVQAKIISGTDANGALSDGTVTWNFANFWSMAESVPGGAYDFQSVAMHELVHTLGFLSTVGAPGDNTGSGWTAFDGFLVSSDGTPVIEGDFRWDSAYDPNLTGGAGGLYFGGPAAVAAYGGPVPLFTPNPWQGGSSVSHLNDTVFYGRSRKLMTARVNTGAGVRTLSAVETGILADLGYTVIGGPGGSASLFFAIVLLRRRRRPACA